MINTNVVNHLIRDDELLEGVKQTELHGKTFYYDITDLINHARFSNRVNGIQRVVLEFAKYINSFPNVKYFYINPLNSNPYSIDELNLKDVQELSLFRNMWFHGVDDFNFDELYELLARRVSGSPSRKLRLINKLLPLTKLPIVKDVFCRTSKYWIKKTFVLNNPLHHTQMSVLDKGDLVAIFGGVWNFQEVYDSFHDLNKDKAKFVTYLHDVIPLVKESIVPTHLNTIFKDYFRYTVECSNLVVTSANNNKLDFHKVAEGTYSDNELPEVAPTGLFYDFGVNSESVTEHGDLRQYVRGLHDFRYVLCVGSIEPRKNHATLIQSWSKFVNSEHYNGERLVIAGTWGREIDDVKQSLFYTGHIAGSILVIEQPSDKELKYLYENCHFTVYPSHYEGWGLPISESLYFGKPVVHFDNSCLSEVSAGYGYVVDDMKGMSSAFIDLFTSQTTYESQLEKISSVQDRLPGVPHILERITKVINDNV